MQLLHVNIEATLGYMQLAAQAEHGEHALASLPIHGQKCASDGIAQTAREDLMALKAVLQRLRKPAVEMICVFKRRFWISWIRVD